MHPHIDNTRDQYGTIGADDSGIFRWLAHIACTAEAADNTILNEQAAGAVNAAGRVEQMHFVKPDHECVSCRRAATASRQAMRMTTPISTCMEMSDFS